MYFRPRANIVTHGEVTGGTPIAEVNPGIAGETEGGGGGVGTQHCRGLPKDDLAGSDVAAGHAVPASQGVGLDYEGIAVVQLGGSVDIIMFLQHNTTDCLYILVDRSGLSPVSSNKLPDKTDTTTLSVGRRRNRVPGRQHLC